MLAIGFALAAATLVLELSGSTLRLAGTDHVSEQGFLAPIPAGGELCQSDMVLPPQAGAVRVLLATRGHRAPKLVARFLSANGAVLAQGRLSAGSRRGWVYIPLAPSSSLASRGTLCIRNFGSRRVVLAGEPFTPGPTSARVANAREPARIDVAYFRPGDESWWQLLGTLSQRFGLGKASLFGDWTLAVLALALLGVWATTARLLIRELT